MREKKKTYYNKNNNKSTSLTLTLSELAHTVPRVSIYFGNFQYSPF